MSRHPPSRPTAAAAVLALAAVAALVLTACASDPRPGTYLGEGARAFEVTLVVDDDLAIPEVRYAVTCDGVTVSETLTLRPPLRSERGQLRLTMGRLRLNGQFEHNGARARGSWHFGDCSGSWRARSNSA
jgi:hypothetical protein